MTNTPDTPDPDEVNLCKGCNTMKHLDANGLCGRCQPDPKRTLDKENSYMGDIAPDQVDALGALQGAFADPQTLTALVQQADNLSRAGDELAVAAARVCAEYDGIHRLRASLSKWYDIRAGIHGTKGSDMAASKPLDKNNTANPPSEELEKQREVTE